MISGRSETGCLAKGCGERARIMESKSQSNTGHRRRGFREKSLGTFDTPARMVAVRWHAEGLFEVAPKMVGAQPSSLCKSWKRYWLGQVILNMAGDDALLPSGKTTAHRAFAWLPVIQTCQLMGKHAAKRLDIATIVRLCPID